MVQGRQRVISYKVHKQVKTPEDEWYTVEGTHEPIIDTAAFEAVQQRLLRDTRTPPGENGQHLFAGFLKCADCGRALHRRSAKGHAYYYCRVGKQSAQACPPRSIREDVLSDAVLRALQSRISRIDDLQQLIDTVNNAPDDCPADRYERALRRCRQDCARLAQITDALYADWKAGDITREEYLRMKADYAARLEQSKAAAAKLEDEQQQDLSCRDAYFQAFREHRNLAGLNRAVLVDFVDTISLRQDRALDIRFRFGCA